MKSKCIPVSYGMADTVIIIGVIGPSRTAAA